MNTQKIYIACLASYNNRILHGKWIDCEDYEQIQDEVNKIMKSSPMDDAEEYAIHDFEGFGSIQINEYDNLEYIAELAEALEDLDENETTLFEYILDNYASNISEAKEKIENVFIFEGTRADYAQEITEECSEIPQHLANYIDYDAMGRDMECNGDLVELDHNVFITNANEL